MGDVDPVGALRWNARRGCWQSWSGRRWTEAAYSLDREALSDPSAPHRRTLAADARTRLLQQVREQEVLAGAELLDTTPDSITLRSRTPVSHVVHFVVTVLTGGLWLAVWLLMALRRREYRRLLRIDGSGHVWVVEAAG